MGSRPESVVSVGFMGSLEALTVNLGWDLHDVYKKPERPTKDLDLVFAEVFNEYGDDAYLSDNYCIGAFNLACSLAESSSGGCSH